MNLQPIQYMNTLSNNTNMLEFHPIEVSGSECRTVPGAAPQGASAPSKTQVLHTKSFRPSQKVNAPGKGGATARTRSCRACALPVQSIRPSDGRRLPKVVARDSSCSTPSARPARMAGRLPLVLKPLSCLIIPFGPQKKPE